MKQSKALLKLLILLFFSCNKSVEKPVEIQSQSARTTKNEEVKKTAETIEIKEAKETEANKIEKSLDKLKKKLKSDKKMTYSVGMLESKSEITINSEEKIIRRYFKSGDLEYEEKFTEGTLGDNEEGPKLKTVFELYRECLSLLDKYKEKLTLVFESTGDIKTCAYEDEGFHSLEIQ